MPTRLLVTLLAAVVIATAAFVALARDRAGGRDVVAVLSSAPGVREGTLVTYLGVHTGFVRTIDVSSGRVVLTLRIRRADAVLRFNDHVALRRSGPLGDTMVEIVPHSLVRGRPIEAADTLREVP